MKMRITKTGAIRDNLDGKIDYRFESALVVRLMGDYMHSCRRMKNGQLRTADNWKKGLGFDSHYDSFLRHSQDLKLILEGYTVTEDGKPIDLLHTLCAIRFNIDGMILAKNKTKKIERKSKK